ncbi:MAG: LamG domain-containing protein, partial [Flavobacteriales bacterium]|nr:LamG domain-containing protein [Flavobacteriales bacterium]
HGLSGTPDMYIVKRTGGPQDWYVWHNGLSAGNSYIILNSIAAQGSNNNMWTQVDSTNINLGPWNTEGGGTKIVYAFKNVEGFSKFGSYVGDLTSQTNIETGFEPAFVMIKCSSGFNSGDWVIYDNKRNPTNPKINPLLIRPYSEQNALLFGINFNSNGFSIPTTCTSNSVNQTGYTYIYMAFAADPDTEAPTVAKSFSTVTYTGTGADPLVIDGLGFKPGLVWIKTRDQAREHILSDIVRGPNKEISSNDTSAEEARGVKSFDDDGFTLDNATYNYNNNGEDYVAWTWKADDNEPTIYGGAAKAVYKFEDNANDVTGTYNGTASNVTYSSSGYFNKTAEFNGSSSYVDVSYNHSNTSFSWSMWVNADSFSNQFPTVIGGMNNSTNTNNGSIVIGATSITIHGSTLYGSVSFSFSTSTWYHVGMVYDSVANTVKAIINGQLYTPSSTTSNTFPSQNKMRIGRADADSTAWDGKIDQVRFYKGAISDIGVAELYAETASDNDDTLLGGPPETIISANPEAGFSIVKWTGAGGTSTLGHGLSAAPELIINKQLSGSNSWNNWIVGTNAIGWDKYLALNLSSAEGNGFNNTPFGDTAPTSTVFTVDSDSGAGIGGSGDEFISYCFHSVAGYSKIGSYAGNGTTQTINVGFQPDFVMMKAYTNSTSNTSWTIIDSVRYGSSSDTNPIYANLSAAEGTRGNGSGDGDVLEISFTSTGFKLGDTGSDNGSDEMNDPNNDYIYMAFKIN